MDVDLNKMTARLKGDESWDEIIIRRLQYSGSTEFSVGRWTSRNGLASRVYEIVSNGEASFTPAWVRAKRDMRQRLRDKKIVFGIIKYNPTLQGGLDETIVALMVPNAWLLHEFRSDPVRRESGDARR